MSTDSVVAWVYLHIVVKGKFYPEIAVVKCANFLTVGGLLVA